jgi:hypothetical protein
MCTGYPVMEVVVVEKEATTTETDAIMPLIIEDDSMAFDCCIMNARK